MNAKTWIAIAILVIASLVLAACAPATTPTTESPATEVPTTVVVTEAPTTQAPLSATNTAEPTMPTVISANCMNPVGSAMVNYTATVVGDPQPEYSFCGFNQENEQRVYAHFIYGHYALKVGLSYDQEVWGCSWFPIPSLGPGLCQFETHDEQTAKAVLTFAGNNVRIELEGTVVGLNCALNRDTTYGTFTNQKILHGETFYYIGSVLTQFRPSEQLGVTCNNGDLITIATSISQFPQDAWVHFGTGNQCQATKDGLGVQWLDVESSGLHLQTTKPFSWCEYHAPGTPTP